MNLEIRKPELVQRLNAHIQTGRFHDADELVEKALDALDEIDALDEKSSAPAVKPHGSLHEFFMNSPLRGANLDLDRVRDYPRAFDLE
jgi:Arc/MetJ-type ribon-helix-helix transcriptional regulator